MPSTDGVYPMPMFARLTVSNLSRSTTWYGAVGFCFVFESPAMAHVRYRRYADIMLAAGSANPERNRVPEDVDRGRGVSLYFSVVDESVDDVARRATEDGGGRIDGPRATPWNTREVVIEDPDGYELVFSEVLDPDRSFEDVMGSIRE